MRADGIGLYVHIPFCAKKCNYCDFCSFPIDKIPNKAEYIDALCREISSYSGMGIEVNSIFFGGGTPSLLLPDEFLRIVREINKSFVICDDCEFTIEANPKTLDEPKLSSYVSAGVNRLSIGVQSIHENELKKLGRIHTFADFLDSYQLARRCGIDNINVDLMYGIPDQTMDSFHDTLRTIISLSPEHISVYGLILEEGTPFFEIKNSLTLPSEDEECDMYSLACRVLASAGYSHYEISNYAKSGLESRHNLKYWRCEEYIGVGVSAYSYFDLERFGNTDDFEEYVSGKYRRSGSSYLSPQDIAYEYVMLGLRLREGISLSEYTDLFALDFRSGREAKLSQLSSLGLVSMTSDRISLTEKGFYLSNYILTELI